MTKDEHIAKLREALEEIADFATAMIESTSNQAQRDGGYTDVTAASLHRWLAVSQALALPSSSEPPQPEEVMRAALQSALGAKP